MFSVFLNRVSGVILVHVCFFNGICKRISLAVIEKEQSSLQWIYIAAEHLIQLLYNQIVISFHYQCIFFCI